MNVIALSIKRPSLVIVLFTITTLSGLVSSRYMSYELLPKFAPPVITVVATYPGASPVEVETSVIKKLEDIISGIENIDKINASSHENFGLIRLELDDQVDVDKISDEIQKKVTQRLAEFPEEMDAPNVGKFDLEDLPMIKLAVNANLGTTEFIELIQNQIQPALSRLEGVAQVSILGGQEREIQVNLFRKKLEAYNVSISQVLEAVGRANIELPAGKIKSSEGQVLVRFSGKITDLVQLSNTVVTTMPDGTKILLKDLAEIIDTNKELEILVRSNGTEAIGVNIQKQSDANAVEVSKLVMAELEELKVSNSNHDLRFTVLQDTSIFTLEAANGVFDDLLLAVILVAMIMFIFLQSLRNSLIIMLAVPLSLVATLSVMYLLGYTYNMMSLLGLTLAVGTLVDDAIVVIENIYRHLEMGKSRWQAAYDGTKELGLTLVATTMTLVVVFVPITLVGGLVTMLLTQFAITIAIAVLFSTVVAFTIVPLLSSRVAKIESFTSNPVLDLLVKISERGINSLANGVSSLLKWALSNKIVTLVITSALFYISISLVTNGFIGIDFLAAGDRGEFLVRLELPKDATLKKTNQLTHQAELLVKERSEVTSIFSTIGIEGASRLGQSTPNVSELNVSLIDKNLRDLPTDIISRQVKNELERKIVGAKIKPVTINILGFADNSPVNILVLGSNPDTIKVFSERIMGELSKIAGITELATSLEDGTPELSIQIDRVKMNSLNLTAAQVAYILRTALTGNTDQKFRDGQTDYDIQIRLDAFDRRDLRDLMNLSFLNPRGERIYLYEFAEIVEDESPAILYRTNRTPSIAITGQIVGRAYGDVNTEVKASVDNLRFPPETDVIFTGSQEQQTQGFDRMAIAGIASIILLYLIMVALYDSFAYPFVVLFTIPLAVIGAFLGLGISASVISLFSMTGLLMLIGLVAKNAILVVDFTVELQNKGMELRAALIEATRLRLRPVLMTNISMIIGLIPIGLATGAGAEWKNGLAWALVGGLTSSMFLSLIVVPVIYYLMERFLVITGLDKRKVEDFDL